MSSLECSTVTATLCNNDMNEQSSDTLDPCAFPLEGDQQRILPNLALHSRIDGPCFSLEVTASREGAELVIQKMRVVGRSLDGIARAAYTFTARIDRYGADKLAPLLRYAPSTKDPQFLYGIFQATEAHSVGDWSVEPLQGEAPGASWEIQPIVPAFEDFCKDVGALSRDFIVSPRGVDDCREKLEMRLSGWGESVELRVMTRVGDEPKLFAPTTTFRVLLPNNSQRTLEESSQQVKGLLEDMARAYIDQGVDGVIQFLSTQSFTVLYEDEAHDRRKRASWCQHGGCWVAARGEISAPWMQARIRYKIDADRARLAVHSTEPLNHPLVDLRISAGQERKALAASQIRAIFALIDCLRHQRWTPRNRFETRVLECLSASTATQSSLEQGSQSRVPSHEALQSLVIAGESFPCQPDAFFTPDVWLQLRNDPRCFAPSLAVSENTTITEAVQGAQWITLELSPALRRKRPELYSTVRIYHRRDGTIKVHATNDLGLSITGSTTRNSQSMLHTLRDVGDAIYRALVGQQHFGWYVMNDAVRSITERGGREDATDFAAINVPVAVDATAKTCVATAGRLASLLLRGGDYGLKCALAPRGEGPWQLTVLSAELRGSVGITITESGISELRFGYTPVSPARGIDGSVEVGTLRCHTPGGSKVSHETLLLCVRSYFRERMSPEASMATNPAALVFQNISRLLRGDGFEAVTCT
ncbi:MAG: hypothetical protein RL518_1338 [Pseudomonadota bacterium]